MSFSLLEATGSIARECVQQTKANGNAGPIKMVLGFVTESADVIRQRMTDQANQKRFKVAYPDDIVFLSTKNTSTK